MKLRCEGIASLILAGILYAGCLLPADAQNTQCADRPAGDSSNACANTRFVSGAVVPGSGGVIPIISPPYNAKCDGTTDDTVAIQSAVTAASAIGATVLYPSGKTCRQGNIIYNRALGGGIKGNSSRIIPSANSTVLFDLTSATTGTSERPFLAEGLTIDGVGFTGTSFIRELNPYNTNINNVTLKNLEYAGVFFRGRAVNISNIQQYGSGTWLFSGVGTGVGDRIFDVNINNVNHQSLGGSSWGTTGAWFSFYRAVGVQLNNVITASLDGQVEGIRAEGATEGLFVSNSIIVFPTTGIHAILGADGVLPTYLYFSNVGVDQPTISSVDLAAIVARFSNFNATFGDLHSNSGAGVVIRSTADDIGLTNFRASNFFNSCLTIEGGATQVRADGITLVNCVNGGAGTALNIGNNTNANVVFYGKNTLGTITATGQTITNGMTQFAATWPLFQTFSAGIQASPIIGGTGTTGTQLEIRSTSGNGTTDAIAFTGGNNGATPFANVSAVRFLIPQATAATSTSTGALVVTGGLGVGGRGYFGGGIFPGSGTFAAGTAQIYTSIGGGGTGLTMTAPSNPSGSTDVGFYSATGALLFGNPSSTSNINFGVAGGGTGGRFLFGGQIVTDTGTPTISSGACGAGTNGVITSGDNQAGLVTIGAAATTTCTISFSATLHVAPKACVISPANAAAAAWATTVARVSSISTSAWVITGTALASTAYYYHCI